MKKTKKKRRIFLSENSKSGWSNQKCYNKFVKGSRNPVLQERGDSVMLGEISPHHEYYDSKSSTETPPSYNQLNYHDNIERFFKSNVGARVPYSSDEENNPLSSSNNSSDEPGKKKTSTGIHLRVLKS